ncbi:MAG: hypothetical protein K0R57_2631 [Paenibacillaceae bacterium]|jgi:hypothetical protein|nr:hypothetical protein [Paenibacillaceae bacterium]
MGPEKGGSCWEAGGIWRTSVEEWYDKENMFLSEANA